MRHPESEIQRSCVKWFRLQYPRYARLLFAVPNGGARSRVEAAIMNGEGVQRGVADLLLLVPRAPLHGLCVEMKTPAGRQSPSQKVWQRAVEAQDYRYALCRSLEEFRAAVTDYLRGDVPEKRF